MEHKIYLSPPNVDNIEKKLFDEAFNSNWIAPVGPHLDQFEKDMCKYTGVGYSCALSSGTAALHLALKCCGIKKRDVVLCPSLTFVATANAIKYLNAIPVFLDSCSKNWVLDHSLLNHAIKKYKPKALVAVDLYGESCDYEAIEEICSRENIFLIEDAAEALGSKYKKKKLGSFGSIGVLSFNGNKIITTSGGGMILSDNESIVKKCKYLSTQAREPVLHYEHKDLGYNYRLSNLLASIGVGQLSKIDNFVKKRRQIYNRYVDALSFIDGICFQKESPNSRSNRWLTSLTIDPDKVIVKNTEIINLLENENIESRPVWKPMHLQPFYKDYDYINKGNVDTSKTLFQNGICLPSGSNLSVLNQNRIIDIILDYFKSKNIF